MGLEDQVADRGDELTSLKNKEQPLYTESESSPWTAIDLLAEKKKEERLGYEPVQYALKGAEPQVGSGDAKVEIQAPKKFAGSSMARNVVEEPVGEKMPMFALKTTKPEAFPLKPTVEGYPQMGTFAAGEHMFVNKKLSPEQAIIHKKLALTQSVEGQYTPTLTKSEGKFGFANAGWQSVPASQALDDGAVKFKIPQGSEGPSTSLLKGEQKGEAPTVFKPERGAPYMVVNSDGSSFVQKSFTDIERGNAPVVEKFNTPTIEKNGSVGSPVAGSYTAWELTTAMGAGRVVDVEKSGSSTSTFRPTAPGSPAVGSPAAERVWTGGSERINPSLVEKLAPVQSGSTSFASSLQKGEPSDVRKIDAPTVQTQNPLSSTKQGGAIFQSKAEPGIQQTQKQLALSEPKQIRAEQQIATTGMQKIEPVKEKVGPTINQQIGTQVAMTAPMDGKVAPALPIVKQEQLSTPMRAHPAAQQNTFKLDQPGTSGEQAVNRAATSKDLSVAVRTDLKAATTGNGATGNGLAIRQAEVAPSLVKKLTQGAESGTQIGLSRAGLEQTLPGKKLITENAAITELPSRFNKTTQLTQIDKLTSDTQLRTQADRIAASSQLKALADQPNIKLKGEIATTNFKPTDHVAVVKPGQQQLENGLSPRIAPLKAVQQQQQLENGLQPRITPVKAAQQQFENGLQPRITPVKAAQQQFESGLQPRIAPLTGKTTQDLVATLKPQDRVAAAHNQKTDLVAANDRRIATSVIRNGADALSTPYTIDRATRMGNAHVVSGDVKVLSKKFAAAATANEVLAGDKKAAPASQIAVMLNNVKDGKGDISRSLSFEHLMTSPVKSTQDRYVGGEFLLASMIIAAGAARRMPEQKAEGQVSTAGTRGIQSIHGTSEVAQGKPGDKSVVTAQPRLDNSANSGQTVKSSPFSQIVDTIAKGFTAGRTSEQTQAIETSKRATFNQGQSDSVRYITGVELAILLAAGGVSKLRSDKPEGQTKSPVQVQDDACARPIKASANSITFANGKQPLNAGVDTHITTQIVANMAGQRAEFTPPQILQPQILQPQILPPRTTDGSASAIKDNKNIGQPSDLVVRGERCIPGADVAIAAMLMLGGVTRKRTEERLPVSANELAEKVDRPFRLDRRLGEIVAQAKSFVAREPMPISGLRATAANLVNAGDVIVPPQYKESAQEQKGESSHVVQHFATTKIYDNNARSKKPNQDVVETLVAPTGWMHEPVLSKELVEEASEEKLKKVEQDQQEGAGAGSAKTLYRPIWIIAPGETFVSIAEDHFGDGAIAWLIADLNIGKFTDSLIEDKRVIEIQSRQRIELPVASDIDEFRHNRQRHQDAENIITIVTASQLDIELKQATFKQFLGTLQNNLQVPGAAVLPQLDLVSQTRTARALAPFGMSAPQFASIAAAVSLPLIVPQLDMVQKSADATTVHVQELRTETAKQEESM